MLRAAVSVLPSALAPASHRRRATRQGKTDVVKVLPSRETTVCKAQGPSAANAIGAVLAATLLVRPRAGSVPIPLKSTVWERPGRPLRAFPPDSRNRLFQVVPIADFFSAPCVNPQVAQPDPASAFLGFFEEPEPKNEYERMLKCAIMAFGYAARRNHGRGSPPGPNFTQPQDAQERQGDGLRRLVQERCRGHHAAHN